MHAEEIELVKYIRLKVPELMKMGTVYLSENLPDKKIKAALKSFAPIIFKDAITAYNDGTVFGKGDNGFIVTTSGLYYRDILSDPVHIPFEHIELVNFTDKGKKLSITYLGITVDLPSGLFKFPETQAFLNEMKRRHQMLKERSVKCVPDRLLALEEMEEQLQINYVKTIIAYEKMVNDSLFSSPLAEILGLMTQLHFTSHMRREIKSFITDQDKDIVRWADSLLKEAPFGNKEHLAHSLLKDIIRVTRTRDKFKASSNPNILQMGKLLNLSGDLKKKVDFIEQMIQNDENLINGEISEKEFTKRFKDLAAGGAAIGFPIAAIYMSGTLGLSAAGITSGLAAFGFGGLLGLSSMVTGIGVLIIGGILVYTGVRYMTAGKQRKIKSIREKMIQEIIKHHQETLNSLIDDINYFTEELNNLSHNYKNNELKIATLKAEIQLFKEAITNIKSKSTGLESTVSR